MSIINYLVGLRYSFATQLVVVHLKKNLILLLFWLVLFSIAVLGNGAKYGAPYTVLEPEYLGQVSWISFFWLGMAFGLFLTAWNLAAYMLNSFRFPFLATLRQPFWHFCINNAVIPLIFIVGYIISLISFHITNNVSLSYITLAGYIAGFGVGIVLVVLLFGLYFRLTNKDIMNYRHLSDIIRKTPDWEKRYANPKIERVDFYLNLYLRTRLVRGTEHYSDTALARVFQQNHLNALLFQFFTALLLMILGQLMDIPIFQLPSAASLMLLMAVLVSLIGAFTYWLTGWRTVGIIALFLLLNNSTEYDWINYNTPAYGLNYDCPPAIYNDTLIKQFNSDAQILSDKQYMLAVLEHWKKKAQAAQGLTPDQKPVMLTLNFSGGGSRAAYWSVRMIQQLDSLMQNHALDNVFMMTGASGGIIGAAYMHELFYRKQNNENIDLQNPQWLDNIGKDLLNPVMFSAMANDIFYPFKKFEAAGYTYRKNRAYAFERKLHINTDSVLANRRINDYRAAEYAAQIPLLIITPTIVSNGKKMIISPHRVAYLTRSTNSYLFTHSTTETDGIEMRFFEQQDGNNLLLSSAVRMSATYPFILPDTYLPTDPPLQVMDAGFRDNHGYETTFRFINTFREWLIENTDRVVMVLIRADQKDEVLDYPIQSYTDRYLKPLQAFVTTDMQDYSIDLGASLVSTALNGRFEVINFEYIPAKKHERAALSLHLAEREKNDIYNTVKNPFNRQSAQKLAQILNRK